MIKRDSINSLLIIVFFGIQILFLFIKSEFNTYSNYSLIIEFLFLIAILIINYKEVLKSKRELLFIFFCLTCSFISIVVTNSGFGGLLNIFNFIVGFYIFSKIKINDRSKFIFVVIFMILNFLMIYYAKDAWNLHILKKSILNPNTIALLIFLSFSILNSLLFGSKNKLIKLLLLVLFCINLYYVYICESRTIFYAMLIYAIITYVPLLRTFFSKSAKKVLILACILGVMIPFVYVYLYKNGIYFNVPFSTKTLYSGREAIWNVMISNLNNSNLGYLFGLGTNNYTIIGIISNYHNWFLGIVYAFGSINCIIYFSYVLFNVFKIDRYYIKNIIICLFIIGMFETAGLWAITHFYIFFILLIGINLDKEVKKNGKNNSVYSNI